jgi:lambda repressor-like predicted transcriptional regulator
MPRRGPAKPLTIEQIIAWAEDHHQRTGKWPTQKSGPVLTAPGETWAAINQALRSGLRGLPRSSLSKVLREQFRLPERRGKKPLFNRDEAITICGKRQTGYTLKELAEDYQVSINTIRKYLQKYMYEYWNALDQQSRLIWKQLSKEEKIERLVRAEANCPGWRCSFEDYTEPEDLKLIEYYRNMYNVK